MPKGRKKLRYKAFLSSDLLVWVKELYNVNNQKSLEWMPLHTVSIKHGLRTTDCGLGIKHGLGIKCGPRTILVNTELIGSSQDVDDFIVDDEGNPIRQAKKKRCLHGAEHDSALKEAQDIFGLDFDFDEFKK